MAKTPTASPGNPSSSSVDDMLLAAMERGGDSLETGRYIVTYSQEADSESRSLFESLDLRTADARDFRDQAVAMDVGDADALILPELGVAIVSAPDFGIRSLGLAEDTRNPVEIVEPEYFMFADSITAEYMRGFRRAAEAIAADAGFGPPPEEEEAGDEAGAEALGATWGLAACKVPQSSRSGAGIRVAVLDTGMDLTHPDFAGRQFVTASFVGQPVQDLHGHGTHCIGTACGPLAPPGTTPRYGVGHKVAPIFVGKVLTNSGGGTTGTVLAGMNWAIANNCTVISCSLGAPIPIQAAYTAAGQAALNRGLLIAAAAGNDYCRPTGAPANSPTIMSVASVDRNLAPSSFSNCGKLQLTAPGRDVFSSWPMPLRYKIISGTSMATPHVAGCAALWAQTSASLRGQALWNKLMATVKPLPWPATKVGKGLVQAPS
ncbi:MAG TPA: S8 family serine peptidase [Allosphingosinicella sp.]|jgi:subtilisin family serine protease